MKYHVYGRTWWSRAWIDTFMERHELDPGQLIRGRADARGGHVSELNVEPGLIDALVQGSRLRPYAVTITVPVLSDVGWVRFFDAVAGQAGHLAALLDGDIATEVGAEANLLPGPSELRSTCSCPDLVPLCRHIAAVGYAIADVFDDDPFALLLLRGRTKADVLSDLRARRQARWTGPAGMLARDAFRRQLATLAPLALPPHEPGTPAPLSAHPPAASGVTVQELSELAAMAAQRAWNFLRT